MTTRVLLLGLLGLAAGCVHRVSVASGTSSFRVVERPPAPPPKASGQAAVQPVSRAQYRDAQIKGDPVLPVYPARALAAKAGGRRLACTS